MGHVLLHFLFLCYFVGSSIMESFSQKSVWWKSVGFSVNFVIYMRIVNTLCISKEKKVYVIYVNLIVKVSKENFENTLDGGILNDS